MGIDTAIIKQMVWGRQRVHFGSYADDSAGSAADIDTGLRRCEGIILWEKKASAPAAAPACDEDFAAGNVDGSKVTIIASVASAAGYWLAWGIGRTKGVG